MIHIEGIKPRVMLVSWVLFSGVNKWINAAISLASVLGVGLLWVFSRNFGENAWGIKTKVFISILCVLLGLALNGLINAFTYMIEPSMYRLKAVRIIKGDGLYEGQHLIVLKSCLIYSKDTLLTLYSSSSGGQIPICTLSVVCSTGAQITTTIFSYKQQETDLYEYFNDRSKLEGLYALQHVDRQWMMNT